MARLFEMARFHGETVVLRDAVVEEKARRAAAIAARASELRAKAERENTRRLNEKAARIARNRRDAAIANIIANSVVRTRKDGSRYMAARPGCKTTLALARVSAGMWALEARPAGGYPRPPMVRPLYPSGALNGPVSKGQYETALMGERARLSAFITKAREFATPTVVSRLEDQLGRVVDQLALLFANRAVKRHGKREHEDMSFRPTPRGWVGASA